LTFHKLLRTYSWFSIYIVKCYWSRLSLISILLCPDDILTSIIHTWGQARKRQRYRIIILIFYWHNLKFQYRPDIVIKQRHAQVWFKCSPDIIAKLYYCPRDRRSLVNCTLQCDWLRRCMITCDVLWPLIKYGCCGNEQLAINEKLRSLEAWLEKPKIYGQNDAIPLFFFQLYYIGLGCTRKLWDNY